MTSKKIVQNLMSSRVCILGGGRIPFQPSGTVYKNYSNYDLTKTALYGLLKKTKVNPKEIDNVLIGNVIQEVKTSNVAREAALGVGIPDNVPAHTISQACISSAQCVTTGVNSILANQANLVVAGGVETFSDVPIRYPKVMRKWLIDSQKEFKKGKSATLKHVMKLRTKYFIPDPPAISNYTTGEIMGVTSEVIAERFGITREDMDSFTIRSHNNANNAHVCGLYDNEIFPVNQNKVENNVRANMKMEDLAKLRTSFKKNGTHTAANSTGLSDGASACLISSEEKANQLGIKPMAYIRASVFVGTDPFQEMLLGPAYAINKLFQGLDISLNDVDVFEIHEAFAGQILANIAALNNNTFCQNNFNKDKVGEVPMDKLNLWGGSLAIGHPLAASNIRNIMTAVNRLHHEDKEYALVAACADSGLANAMLIQKN